MGVLGIQEMADWDGLTPMFAVFKSMHNTATVLSNMRDEVEECINRGCPVLHHVSCMILAVSILSLTCNVECTNQASLLGSVDL